MGVETTAVMVLHLAAVAAGFLAIRACAERRDGALACKALALAASALVAALVFAVSDPHGAYRFRDFTEAYHPAGQAVLAGPSALTPILGNGVLGFVNLPVVAYLFAPFGLLDAHTALVVFSILGLAATAWAWVLLVRVAGLEGIGPWLLLFLFAANGPLIYSIKLGNTSHMVLLALVGALALLHARRDAMAGAVLAVAALIKLPLLVFGAYFVLRRNWRAAAAFTLVCAVAGLLSLAIFGWDVHWRWLELSVLQFSSRPVGAWNVQSIPGLLDRLVNESGVLLDWTPHAAGIGRRALGAGLTLLMFLAAIYACTRAPLHEDALREEKAASDDLEFMIVLLLAVVASPLSWSHYYAWVLIPIAFALGARPTFVRDWTTERLALLGILLVTPIAVRIPFAESILLTLYAKIGVSHLFFGGVVWLVLLLWARATIGDAARPRPQPRRLLAA